MSPKSTKTEETLKVSHAYLCDARFWQFLYELDCDLAAQARAGGCVHCAGVVHSARYPRKPWGVARELLGEAYWYRESLCCSAEGCRRRCTPASVRFLGRRMYLGVLVVLVTALSQGLASGGRRRVAERFGVSERTLRRWQRWWREVFAVTALWASARGWFVPPVAVDELPQGLLSRFGELHKRESMVAMMRFLRPVSIGSLRVR